MIEAAGLRPTETRDGDVICVLLRYSVPVILRPTKDNPNEFYFVGKAYVHGAMDGQTNKTLYTGAALRLRDHASLRSKKFVCRT
jgi:hypothetical protein